MGKNINRYIDAAVLSPELTKKQVTDAINQCIGSKTRTVCVRPCDIDIAVSICRGTQTGTSCVLSFPHGTSLTETKVYEAKLYTKKGIDEIDMVANYSSILSNSWGLFKNDVNSVINVTKDNGVILKVILETCCLSTDMIRKATEMCAQMGVDFVKTSTGYSKTGATIDAIMTMLEASKDRIKVKASGGIRDYQTAKMYVDMGVQRIGANFTSVWQIINSNDTKDKNENINSTTGY